MVREGKQFNDIPHIKLYESMRRDDGTLTRFLHEKENTQNLDW